MLLFSIVKLVAFSQVMFSYSSSNDIVFSLPNANEVKATVMTMATFDKLSLNAPSHGFVTMTNKIVCIVKYGPHFHNSIVFEF